MQKNSIVIRINKKLSHISLYLHVRKQIIYLEEEQLSFVGMKTFY